MANLNKLPVDVNYHPADGAYDPVSHTTVAVQAGTVATDGTNGTQYAPLDVSVSNVNNNGQATMSGSAPVVIASDQSPVAISQPTVTAGTITSVAATTTASTQLLASNPIRKGMMIYNESSAVLYLAFNSTCTTTFYTVQIPASGFFEMPTAPVYTGIITGVWSAANGSARITELHN